MYIKKLLKNKTIYFSLVFVGSLLFFGCGSVNAATLQINSNSTTISLGDTITLYLVLNSEGVAINNAEAIIKFPNDLFDVVSIGKSSSIFSLWVEEPYFSNSSGVISFNGGVPTPGFNGSQGSVISIIAKAKKTGQANFSFSSAAVRANDGLGTDVLNNKQGKSITIIEKKEPVIIPTVPVQELSQDLVLQITSPTHTNQEQWYKDRDPIFRWAVSPGVDAVQMAIDNNNSGAPRVIYSPAIKEKSIKDLKDGIWYFKVRARKDGKWGSVSTYITRVDNTLPIKNGVNFSYDDSKKILEVNADIIDETSGLDYYNIYINDLLIEKVPSAEFVNGNYSLIFKTPGDNNVKLVAVDRAGNSVESSGTFQTTAIPESVQPATSTDKQLLLTIGSFSAPAFYIIIIVLLLMIILLLVAFYLGSYYGKPHHKIKLRNALAKGDNTKVLHILKKRLEKHLEILQNIRHNRILSKEEKDIKAAIEGDLDEVDNAIEEQK